MIEQQLGFVIPDVLGDGASQPTVRDGGLFGDGGHGMLL
jgi:hypothetical protein